MPNEKMSILKMLEEGKITSDEAARLLEALGKSESRDAAFAPRPSHDNRHDSRHDDTSSRANRPTSSSRSSGSPVAGLDNLADELGRKFDAFARDFEPRLQKFSEAVAEKTVAVADKIAKTLETSEPTPESRPSSQTYAPKEPRRSVSASATEKTFELRVGGTKNELVLKSKNADISVKGYNGDKITMRLFYVSARAGANIELLQLGNKYYLHYEEDDFERIGIDAYVPETLFESVQLENINGNTDVANLSAAIFACENQNGHSTLKEIRADNMKIENNNGRLMVFNITSKAAQIENSSGEINAGNLDILSLKLISSNGKIAMSMANFAHSGEYNWLIETNNAPLNLNLPSLPTLGYHIKAQTSCDQVKLGLVGLNYITSEASYAEVKSLQYDTAGKHIKMYLETSNAPINVN